MPTKLKKPITVTVETVEEAIVLHSMCSLDRTAKRAVAAVDEWLKSPAFEWTHLGGPMGQIRAGLISLGIDYRTWTPPQPLKAGKYDAEILPGGAIKVECQTITREQILELKKASDEAVEPVAGWPRWFHRYDNTCFRVREGESFGTWVHRDRKDEPSSSYRLNEVLKMPESFRPITATEAARILGKEVA